VLIFGVLLIVSVALLGLDALGVRPAYLRSRRSKLCVALAAMFLLAATARLASPDMLVEMVPAFLPFRQEAVYLSGLFEVLGAIGLLIPRFRRVAGWGLIALLVVVLPANLNVALHNLQLAGYPGSPVYQWARVALQFVLIGLVWWASRPASALTARPARGAHQGVVSGVSPKPLASDDAQRAA
jgi:uncharacterized membrane protein